MLTGSWIGIYLVSDIRQTCKVACRYRYCLDKIRLGTSHTTNSLQHENIQSPCVAAENSPCTI